MTTTPKSNLIETQEAERDCGCEGTRAIANTASHDRILIEDGFGGIDTIEGGCVRWKHGSTYKLQPGYTFESLKAERGTQCGAAISGLGAVIRLYLQWLGRVVASIAKSLDFK